MAISRRNFIKGTAGATTLGVFGSMLSSDKWLVPATAASEIEETFGYTYHQIHCKGYCAMKCTVRDGKLVKIEPNLWPDKTPSTICLKGLSEVQRVYSPERIKTPLKRVGKRGEGKFVAISWDEALTIVADKLGSLIAQYGGKSIFYAFALESWFTFLPSLLGAQLSVGAGLDLGMAGGFEPAFGTKNTAVATNEISDWMNAKTILNLGSNILETGMTDAKWLFSAKEAGVTIITIDPYYSTTAAHSNRWVPIKPGTDGALLLGMITCILDNGWCQSDYLQKNTSAPFLIRSDNQKLVRQNDSADGPDKNPFLVWDQISNGPKPYNTPGIVPELEGEFTINGMNVKTVFSALKENQKQYTLAWAAGITEIPEQDIKEITEAYYAKGGPSALSLAYGGGDKWANADIAGHAALILAALTGNIGRVGGGAGVFAGHGATAPVKFGPWPLPPEFKPLPLEKFPTDMMLTGSSVKAYVNMGDTLQQYYPNFNQTVKWLEELDFILTIEIFHNTSVDYSDIVLPSCTRFEIENAIGLMVTNKNHILLQQKVIEPLYESKSDFQIEHEIAEKLGLAQHLPKTLEEYQRARLNSPDPALKGITLEALKANNGIMDLNVPKEPYRQYMDQVYLTPSRKLELYYENMIEFNQALPVYEEPSEATASNPLFKKYPLQLSQQRSRYRIHSAFYNATWINQYTQGPKLYMNPADGEQRNLVKGDLVEVFNDRGSFACHYEPDNGVRPGHPRVFEGAWSRYMQKGNLQEVTNDKIPPRGYKIAMGPVHPFNDTLVEVRKIEEVK